MTQNKSPLSSRDLARERTEWAFERTQMASTRTFFALLRTGLAIAGGGSVLVAILGSSWPDWLVAILVGMR